MLKIYEEWPLEARQRFNQYLVSRWGLPAFGRPMPEMESTEDRERRLNRERQARFRNGSRNADVTENVTVESNGESVTPPPTPPVVTFGEVASPRSRNGSKSQKQFRQETHEILDFLNKLAGKSFRPVPANLRFIEARLDSGVTVSNCKGVIARKVRESKNGEFDKKYLRPETLFNETKFEQYLGEREVGDGA